MIFDLCDLVFAYPGSDRNVLRGVGMKLGEGETLSVLGPNGAGKSTLLSCMAGLLRPQTGCVRLLGEDIRHLTEKKIAAAVSLVPQNHYPIFGYTVFDFVLMGRASLTGLFQRPRKEDRKAAEQALEELGLTALAEKPCTEISGGERQLATIARAIVRRPKAVLFDEPTAHLDFGNQLRTLRVVKSLADKGYAVVITTHNPDHAMLLGGRTVILGPDGQLTAGKTEEVLTEETLRRVYTTDLRLKYDEELGRKVCLYPNL